MPKVLWFRFEQCLQLFTILLSEGSSETEIYLTTVFLVRNFENTSSMRVMILLKIFKILSTIQKCLKTDGKKFSLLEIIVHQLATSNCLY